MNTVKKSSTEPSGQGSVRTNAEYTIIDRKSARRQGLSKFYTGKPCNNGHFSLRYVGDGKCVQCVSERNKKRYDPEKRKAWHQKYYEENSHRVKRYQTENRDHILKKKKEYRNKKREQINAKKREWNKKNKEHIRRYKDRNSEMIKKSNAKYYERNKQKFSDRARKYNRENPMVVFTRTTLKRIERAKGVERIKRAEIELGYTQEEFINHITSKFKKGMSWENRSEWHIDHIIPLSVMVKRGVTDIKVINALSNLQPLWAKENMEKHNKCQ